MILETIFSGFGGQGIMLMGQLLAQTGLDKDRQVSWIPSYGPEMRGGTAYCSIVISDQMIGSPVVTEPDLCFAMNLPSLRRFADAVKPGGTLLINSSLIDERSPRQDIRQFPIPANTLAEKLGSAKVLNVIALGAVSAVCGILEPSDFQHALRSFFGTKYPERPELLSLNLHALDQGIAAVAAAA